MRAASERDRLLPREQVMVRLGLVLDDQLPEVVPEAGVRDRQVADLPALREDREPLAVVVEVLELDDPQRALAEPVVEQQPKRQLVANVRVAWRGSRSRSSGVNVVRRTARVFARSMTSVGSP